MKKVFGLLFVAGLFAFASCNNTEETATEAEVTETETVETMEVDTDMETEMEADTVSMEEPTVQ
jgi:hypothetical protein